MESQAGVPSQWPEGMAFGYGILIAEGFEGRGVLRFEVSFGIGVGVMMDGTCDERDICWGDDDDL